MKSVPSSSGQNRTVLYNPVARDMIKQGRSSRVMRDRRKRRAKDARRSWKNEEH